MIADGKRMAGGGMGSLMYLTDFLVFPTQSSPVRDLAAFGLLGWSRQACYLSVLVSVCCTGRGEG